MSNILTCDSCDSTESSDTAIGWVTIDDAGLSAPTFGSPTMPRHACSIACTDAVIRRLPHVPVEPRSTSPP